MRSLVKVVDVVALFGGVEKAAGVSWLAVGIEQVGKIAALARLVEEVLVSGRVEGEVVVPGG